jgi:hypothetical protein
MSSSQSPSRYSFHFMRRKYLKIHFISHPLDTLFRDYPNLPVHKSYYFHEEVSAAHIYFPPESASISFFGEYSSMAWRNLKIIFACCVQINLACKHQAAGHLSLMRNKSFPLFAQCDHSVAAALSSNLTQHLCISVNILRHNQQFFWQSAPRPARFFALHQPICVRRYKYPPKSTPFPSKLRQCPTQLRPRMFSMKFHSPHLFFI